VAGRYRVVEKLGEGGMGAVYRAVQEPLGREVALKVIAPALARDGDAVERFRREAKAASSLSHPHIVTVYDFGADGGLLFLAMELIHGVGLDLVVRRGPTPPARAIAILRGVCAALAEAHARGIIHRDLKPQNIMLTSTSTQQDVVKVVDFGIARLADHAGATLTQTGAVVGTPGYVAPELFDGAAPSPSSDLYAVGVVAYELLAGVAPFPGGTPREILKAVLFGEPPPLRAFVRDVPPALEGLVMGLLDKDPAKRPGNARAVEAALSALAGQAPGGSSGMVSTSPEPPTPSTPAGGSTSVQVFGTETMLPPAPDTGDRRPPPPPLPPTGGRTGPTGATPPTGTMTTSGTSPVGGPIGTDGAGGPSTSTGKGVPGWVIGVGVVVGGLALGTPIVLAAIADALKDVTVRVTPEDVQRLIVTTPAVVEPDPALTGALQEAGPEGRAALLQQAREALADPDLAPDERAEATALIALIEGTIWPAAGGPGVARSGVAIAPRPGIGTRTNADLRREAAQALRDHDVVRAERALEQLRAQSPDDVEGAFLMGELYAQTGRPIEARLMRRRFLRLAPGDPRAPDVKRFLEQGLDEVRVR
jgi:serine/threonine protein kinase